MWYVQELLPLVTLTRCRAFATLDQEMTRVSASLKKYGLDIAKGRRGNVDVQSVFACITRMQSQFGYLEPEAFEELLLNRTVDFYITSEWADRTIETIQRVRTDGKYLARVATFPAEPQEHDYICDSFRLKTQPRSIRVETYLDSILIPMCLRGDALFFQPFVPRIIGRLATFSNISENTIPFSLLRPLVYVDPNLSRAALAQESATEHHALYLDASINLSHLTYSKLVAGYLLPLDRLVPAFGLALSAITKLRPSPESIVLVALLKMVILISFYRSTSGCVRSSFANTPSFVHISAQVNCPGLPLHFLTPAHPLIGLKTALPPPSPGRPT
ncbi:hypothetical protein C8J57DRAFT_1516836 [Mycena rebaudengoi]|nr:hypothetical protein C8J57DRAFT_1516836 [Mycena rebaudengoi]